MTKKSHSLVTGAMLVGEDEKCREKDESLVVAVFEAVLGIELTRMAMGLMRRGGNGESKEEISVWSPVTCYLTGR
jgi:hypothetical protein